MTCNIGENSFAASRNALCIDHYDHSSLFAYICYILGNMKSTLVMFRDDAIKGNTGAIQIRGGNFYLIFIRPYSDYK